MNNIRAKQGLIFVYLLLGVLFSTGELHAIKPTPPLDIGLSVSDKSQLSDRLIEVTVAVASREHKRVFTEVKVDSQPILGCSLLDPAVINIKNLEFGKPYAIKFKVRLDQEKSELVVKAVVFDPSGKTLFGRATHLYLIWDGRDFYSGTSSHTELMIKKLRRDLWKLRISPWEYNRRMRILLGGGATETDEPSQ